MSDSRPTGDLRGRLSSFTVRLRLFFVLVVLVPMLAVTLVVFRLIADSERGQADARLAARQDAAISVSYDARARADALAGRVGRDRRLSVALRRDDRAAVLVAARRLLGTTSARRILLDRRGLVLADVGSTDAAFPATRALVDGGRTVAELQVSVLDAAAYTRFVRRITGLEAIVRRGSRVIASTIPRGQGALVPTGTGTVAIAGRRYRAASFAAPGFSAERLQVSLLEPESRTTDAIRHNRLLAGLVLAGFFLLAIVAVLVVSRSLDRQIGAFLSAARRLAAGDFSARVPIHGQDAFAQLGEEFNKMSDELERRIEELAQERLRLELSLRRTGETFAASLDRDGLLRIVVRTAVDGVDAEGGEALMVEDGGRELDPVVRIGGATPPPAAAEAQRRAFATGEPAFANLEGQCALAHPLHAGRNAGDRGEAVTGIVSVWRASRPFTHRERELFNYLAAQAAVSVENVDLHETVERQAVTDELTGLSNRRRFQEVLADEVERSRRFGHELGLVMLDIDDFKAVNDGYGHQQGDLVLREVARILASYSREIDDAARYGGEELAVILPGTGLAGAFRFAERAREGIEGLRLPILGDESAEPLRVTASFGVAALPGSAEDLRGLVAAADEALYQAKHAGKNQTASAA